MAGEYVETRTIVLRLRDDGILHGTSKFGVDQTLDDARENLDAAAALLRGKTAPLLMDIRNTGTLSHEARRLYASESAAKVVNAQGFIAASSLDRVIGNLFIRVAKTTFPTRLFASEKDALVWLSNYR